MTAQELFLSFTSLFWYKLVFMTELLVSEIIFTHRLRLRGMFPLRLALCLAALYAITFFFPLAAYNTMYSTFVFFTLYVCTLIAMKAVFNESWKTLLFCSIAAYTVQHMSYELFNFVVLVSGLNNGASLNVYGSGSGLSFLVGGSGGNRVYDVFILMTYAAMYFVLYWAAFVGLSGKIGRHEELISNNKYLILLCGLLLFVDILLGLAATYAGDGEDDFTFRAIIGTYNIICCFLVLAFQFGRARMEQQDREYDMIRSLWRRDKEHYESAKENVNVINVKCHDLKHYIGMLRGGSADEKMLSEIERAVSDYDAVVRTGNETLDVVLTEKTVFCRAHGVQLTCMADGEALSFMDVGDIYSLFGNALSNAIEYVRTLDDEDKRIVRLSMKRQDRLLSVHVENYFEGPPPATKDGLPVTTKEDKTVHGYGMLSMKMLAEKYGGRLFVSVAGGMFNLDIIFNLPDVHDK